MWYLSIKSHIPFEYKSAYGYNLFKSANLYKTDGKKIISKSMQNRLGQIEQAHQAKSTSI